MSRFPRTARDATLGATVAGAALVSWVVPERAWWPLTRALAWAAVLVRPGAGSLPVDGTLARDGGLSARRVAVERIASGTASRLVGLREYRRAAPEYPVSVSGAHDLEQALAGGRGAVLWIGRFTWASLISKVGLHRAGFSVTHLSRPEHGFGSSAFATTRLNPIWTGVEERFLRERIVMAPGAETAALRALRRRLDANGVVSISVGAQGARTVSLPFLGAELRLATGPISLAASSGAPLMPVFAIRDAHGGFHVTVEPPLDVGTGDTRGRRQQEAASAYARRLETWVRRWPGQWLG
jgi:lauroyl/myristoyl acyltransferase